MKRPRAFLCPVLLSVAAFAAVPAQAQQGLAPPAAGPALAAAEPDAKPSLLRADDLDRLLEPFAGAPQDTLGVVLDACRYPSDLLEAARWTEQPEGARGGPKDSWPPTVRLLAERAPRTLEFLTRDLAHTAALGSAYQNQPNDVWLAYGRVTDREAQAERRSPQEATAEGGGPPPTEPAGASSTSRSAAAAAPAAPPRQAPAQQAAPDPASAPAAAPPAQVVVAQPAPSPGPSAAGAAIAGGVVGLGAGLLIAELADDNDGGGYGYPRPYAVPPPYMPHAGGGNAARGLQDSRQAAAREMQANRQSFATADREDRQSFTAEQRQQRQTAESQRQAQRQTARGDRQVQRQQSAQASGPQGAAAHGTGRRDLATAGLSRPAERSPSAQRAASARPAAQGGAPRPEWGPTQGMHGDRLAATRARQPSAGVHGGGAGARGGHPGRR